MENIMSSKLFTTRQGTVLLGVVAAVIAAIALIVYLDHYRSSLSQPDVKVLVAKRLIQKGTPGDVIRQSTAYYTVAKIPQKQVDSGAIVNPAALAGKVALTDISGSQQLTAADFGTGTGIANELGPNDRAVVVALGSPQAVGGQITAGSHVDVWVTTSGQGTSGVSRPIAKLLYQDVEVLSVSGGNVTLKATPTEAGTLIYASTNAQLWLDLRPTIGTKPKSPVISSNAVIGH